MKKLMTVSVVQINQEDMHIMSHSNVLMELTQLKEGEHFEIKNVKEIYMGLNVQLGKFNITKELIYEVLRERDTDHYKVFLDFLKEDVDDRSVYHMTILFADGATQVSSRQSLYDNENGIDLEATDFSDYNNLNNLIIERLPSMIEEVSEAILCHISSQIDMDLPNN